MPTPKKKPAKKKEKWLSPEQKSMRKAILDSKKVFDAAFVPNPRPKTVTRKVWVVLDKYGVLGVNDQRPNRTAFYYGNNRLATWETVKIVPATLTYQVTKKR